MPQVEENTDDFETIEFLQQLRNRDENSFDRLYRSYEKKIFNLAYRLTGSEEEASNITQETFFQVYRTIDSFRGESSLFTWIYAIARNSCFRYFKEQKHLSFLNYEQMISEALHVEAPSDIDESEKKMLIEQVKIGCLTGLIRCLSCDQRMAFTLNILCHIPAKETAQIMGKSMNAVKVLVHRARVNIKTFLCRNCSLYNRSNPCKCENLIGFSLRQGWISIDRPTGEDTTGLDTGLIEKEILALNRIMEFYRNLNAHHPPADLVDKVKAGIDKGDWRVLN